MFRSRKTFIKKIKNEIAEIEQERSNGVDVAKHNYDMFNRELARKRKNTQEFLNQLPSAPHTKK